MRRTILAGLVAIAMCGSGALAAAQLPPPLVTIEMMQADMVAKSGSDTVYFAGNSHGIDAATQATLTAQARWLLAHPEVRARIEGHADERTARDYALATGERRANAVRDFLVLQGVPAAQLTTISWGKERPAVGGTSEMALALNRRVSTVLMR
jgi:peptidoglycan-associated lipoprotein